MQRTITFRNFSGCLQARDITPLLFRGLYASLRRAFALCGIALEYVCQESSDIVLYSAVPPPPAVAPASQKHVIRILWCVENLARWTRIQRQPINVENFAASMTSEPDRSKLHIRMPNWLYQCADFHLRSACSEYCEIAQNAPVAFDRKPTSITLIARSNEPPHYRTRLLAAFAKLGIRVDCPSTLGKNTRSIEERGLTKREFCRNYAFCICPENTFAPGYTTEKLMDALLAGCIPIYWGDLRLDEAVFNRDRIIFIENVDETAARVVHLMSNVEQLRVFFEQPRFAAAACSVIDAHFEKQQEMVKTLVDRWHNQAPG
jgi:hypothetical protein